MTMALWKVFSMKQLKREKNSNEERFLKTLLMELLPQRKEGRGKDSPR